MAMRRAMQLPACALRMEKASSDSEHGCASQHAAMSPDKQTEAGRHCQICYAVQRTTQASLVTSSNMVDLHK